MKPSDTVKAVKKAIKNAHLPIPPDMQRLTFEAGQLGVCICMYLLIYFFFHAGRQ